MRYEDSIYAKAGLELKEKKDIIKAAEKKYVKKSLFRFLDSIFRKSI